MMARIIDGKGIRDETLAAVAVQVEELRAKGVEPCLAVIIVGDDPASRVYVNNKKRSCERVGIRSLEFALPGRTSQAELLDLVDRLNADPCVNGILCQLPLPGHIDQTEVLCRISPQKDVDAFHPQNVGHIMIGDFDFLPCTPAGIMTMLHRENITIEGKHCVVIGRSNIVGKPMAMLLLKENATVTVCHSKTKDLKETARSADILVVAIGRAKFVTRDMVKPGAVVIDVGMNRDEEGRLCGDVDFESVAQTAAAITPVPGGVGPMTIATLMQNTLTAARLQNKM